MLQIQQIDDKDKIQQDIHYAYSILADHLFELQIIA